MSAIAGIVYPNAFQASHTIDRMLLTLSHRGAPCKTPYTFKNYELGVCGGETYTDPGKLIVGIDGAFSNLKELKLKLRQEGMPCFSDRSEEACAKAYRVFGRDCLKSMSGDFALFIFDPKEEMLLLARDRIGKKPLYWYRSQNTLIFASELKAILSTGLVPQSPESESLATYLYFGYIPQDMSPIKGINKMLPGYSLCYKSGESTSIDSFWSLSTHFQKQKTMGRVQALKQVEESLQKAIIEEIDDLKSYGCFISGGLGSASIAYYLNQARADRELHFFTTGFEGEEQEDIAVAKEVARQLGAPQTIERVTPETFLHDLPLISWYLDEPIADVNVAATWTLSTLAHKNGVKDVFSGMGSDELLAGHSRYSLEERNTSLQEKVGLKAKNFARLLLLPLLHRIYKPLAYNILKSSRTNLWQYEYLRNNALFGDDHLLSASPELANLFDPEVFLNKFENISKIQSTVAAFLYFDVKTRLTDCFVLQYERLTAANRLCWHTPYLNQTVIENLASLPEPDVLEQSETAHYLKKLMREVYSQKVVDRPKVTRKNFLSSWGKHEELYRLFCLLQKGTLVETGLISENWILKHTETPQAAMHAFRHLFAILTLEIWFALFINRPVETKPPDATIYELLTKEFIHG